MIISTKEEIDRVLMKVISNMIKNMVDILVSILVIGLMVTIFCLDKKIRSHSDPKLVKTRKIFRVILMVIFLSLAVNMLDIEKNVFNVLVVGGYTFFVMYEYFEYQGRYGVIENEIIENTEYQSGRWIECLVGIGIIELMIIFVNLNQTMLCDKNWTYISALIPLITVFSLFVAAAIEFYIYGRVSRAKDILNVSEDLSTTLIIPIIVNELNDKNNTIADKVISIVLMCSILAVIYYKKED